MKSFLKVLVLVLVLCLSVCLVGCSNDDPMYYNDNGDENQEVLTVVLSPDYAPYEFINDITKTGYKQYAGADVEVAKYIAKELGMKLKITSANFDLCPSEVNAGKADLSISGFSWTPARAENYELSNTYFAEGDGLQQVLILKENAEKFKSLADLNKAEVKVAAQGGSLQDELVDAYLPNATKENFDNIDQAVQLLISGKYDAIALSEHTVDVRVQANDKLQALGENFPVQEAGLVVLAKKGNTELMAKVNAAIAKIVEQNLYSKWMEEAKELAKSKGLDVE